MAEDLSVSTTPIPGLFVVSLPLHEDDRGWFKENWQREKMIALGLPDFHPVQNNVAFNAAVGTTRGIHAEPWDKLVSVASGRAFGAWVDLRQGDSFGKTFTIELHPGVGVFVPRGVANAYQTLEPATSYSYLVNDHWSPEAIYTYVNLADETAAINWPIPLSEALLSSKDVTHPHLDQAIPITPRKTLILGAGGQLGKALTAALPHASAWNREEFDLTDARAYSSVPWRDYNVVINAAAYTNVDEAETLHGRRDAWKANVSALVHLARVATTHHLTVVHVSSDYVFDGEVTTHTVDEGFSPLGVYGQTKAAGDAVISTVPRHYIVRTSWVIGNGPNFVATMRALAESGDNPSVVDDQFGRLTTTSELADGIIRLLDAQAPYGVHHITGGGEPRSWYEIARQVFADAGHDPARVLPISSDGYAAGRAIAPRPRNSTLS